VHDAFTALLSHQSPVADLAVGAAIEIALGYSGTTEPVLTGEAVAVDRLPGGVRVEGLAKTHLLARTRAAQSYLDQTVADIVRDLLSKAGIDSGEIDASLKLASHHVDERRTVWAHLVELARLASCDLAAAADGSLDCHPPRSGPTPDHTLRHGADLIAWSIGPRSSFGDPPLVVPHGAASEAGAEKWHLLLREPDRGSPSAPTVVVQALSDRDGARALEEGLRKATERQSLSGRIVVVGNVAIRPGHVLQLSDLPNGEDCIARALAVRHGFDAAAGFRTTVAFEGVAS
jgi:hypothetical protein